MGKESNTLSASDTRVRSDALRSIAHRSALPDLSKVSPWTCGQTTTVEVCSQPTGCRPASELAFSARAMGNVGIWRPREPCEPSRGGYPGIVFERMRMSYPTTAPQQPIDRR